ncbi:MAG TPA: ROK family protein [Iamia sp.]|nr:ROK family protein [Iamia sp.]
MATTLRPGEGAGSLLQILRDGVPRTRSELAVMTGLGRSAVAQRVDALLASSLVGSVGEAASTGGRPPAQLAFNPGARVALAVDVGATHVRIGLTDLASVVLAEDRHEIDISLGPEAVLTWAIERSRALLAELGRDPADLIGVGIGLPGPVEHATGKPRNPPIMPGWDGFDVPLYVGSALGTVVVADNDVNVMALGERFLGFPTVDQLLFVKVATGIGSGIISHGTLHRGADGAAGDLGHIQVPDGEDVLCRCGNRGCLEAIASGAAVATRLRATGLDPAGSGDVVDLVKAGSVPALQEVRQAGRVIGEVLASAVSLLNPSVIVIGGSLAAAGDPLLAGVREVVYRRSLPLATANLRIVPAVGGERAGIIGAACLVIDEVLAPDAVDRYVA